MRLEQGVANLATLFNKIIKYKNKRERLKLGGNGGKSRSMGLAFKSPPAPGAPPH
jgi:hypothetical protein